MSIVIWLLTFVLVLISIFLVLIVLAQKSKSDGGVGAALGGGMTEATFGADSGNVLATLTRNGTIAFFVICFGLYLAHIHRHTATKEGLSLPAIPAAAEALPASTPEAAVAAPSLETAPAPALEAAPVAELAPLEAAVAPAAEAVLAEPTPAAEPSR
ncbi:MAG: preprotein translocase subunit SecG [Verrucomicrobia bacterium]|nr:MAG: preprotein translocase subunit SecG [Verrucomicrobiota bacterium]